MKPFLAPTVDDSDLNPFYCPAIPADVFLQDLRFRVAARPWAFSSTLIDFGVPADDSLVSFAARLCDAEARRNSSASFLDSKRSTTAISASASVASLWDPRLASYNISRSLASSSGLGLILGSDHEEDSVSPKGREPHSFSALEGSPAHGLSPISLNNESFVLSGKADRLSWSPRSNAYASPDQLALHETLKGGQKIEWLGPETPRSLALLIVNLEALLPGVRLQEKLNGLRTTHQNILDALAVEGHITDQVLRLFCSSEVECLDLAASMADEDGLNLGARDLLRVLSTTDSFLFLEELNFAGVALNDADILYFNRLPRLSRLWLSNTGIGNEAMYHLVALKRSLEELDLSLNLDISDDSVPPLICLRKLCFLSLSETKITISGMRRLAVMSRARVASHDDPRCDLQVDPPREVEEYLDDLDSEYLLYPTPPLITVPDAVPDLTVAALKRNLAAHADCNPKILASGTKAEMIERLSGILRAREGDLAVKAVLGET
ncbi:hypothetical protein C8Q79DRAFT_461996 [Trametes meyenii]|nr:hypothetical protein C8Q79DRAFT_461996 [Trametes meyenii]